MAGKLSIYPKLLAVWVGIFMGVLIIGELIFRAMGYQPGDMSPNWLNFEPVDSLIVYDDFYVNDDAILVANPDFEWFKDLHINDDGFRCLPFENRDTTKTSVLLIGDSFVWGMTAEPIDSSFPDILRTETNYEIFNTGIPAADPVQYALIAEKYIPELKPDIVLLYFFMGNDIMFFDRIPEPNKNFYYYTNAGAILAHTEDKEFESAEAAYHYFSSEKYFLKEPDGLTKKIVASSAILSKLYALTKRVEEKKAYERGIKDFSLTNEYLLRVKQVAKKHEVIYQIIVIPEVKEADFSKERYKSRYESLFAHPEIAPIIHLPKTQKSDFNPYPDAHLNNQGHRVYADFTKELLRSID